MSLKAAYVITPPHVENIWNISGKEAEYKKRKTFFLLHSIAYLRQTTNCMNQFRLLKLYTSLSGRMKQQVKSSQSKFKHFLRNIFYKCINQSNNTQTLLQKTLCLSYLIVAVAPMVSVIMANQIHQHQQPRRF